MPRARVCVAFLVLAALWAEAHGMHFAANSLRRHVTESTPQTLQALAYFYDESLSHLLWHSAVVGLSALCLWPRLPGHEAAAGGLALPVGSGLLYGFTFFCMVIEGQTAPLGIPFAVGAVGLLAVHPHAALRRRPVSLFFFAGYAFAGLLFLVWGIWWGGLPEFSVLGLI